MSNFSAWEEREKKWEFFCHDCFLQELHEIAHEIVQMALLTKETMQ
jgi:hypothetical protein